MSEWQPIETAPRDGTEVLLWWNDVSLGRWHGGEWVSSLWVEYDTAFLAAEEPDAEYCTVFPCSVTHWMPLPEPPNA